MGGPAGGAPQRATLCVNDLPAGISSSCLARNRLLVFRGLEHLPDQSFTGVDEREVGHLIDNPERDGMCRRVRLGPHFHPIDQREPRTASPLG
ncbi:hypothetical protein AN403_4725 [Pseudomonas fluorescens]|uniref:Uncharacterized protein n=1 Tax=Pseudomonas fluorescens TaxID=294 RepID=A0A0P8XKD3_PSEFL|nr:hypothetical protein AN403_4725 [Pseudomonas fluorescens]